MEILLMLLFLVLILLLTLCLTDEPEDLLPGILITIFILVAFFVPVGLFLVATNSSADASKTVTPVVVLRQTDNKEEVEISGNHKIQIFMDGAKIYDRELINNGEQ